MACVRSLQEVAYERLRILVVDNASPGGAGGRLVPWRGLAVNLHQGEVRPVSALGEPRPVSFVTGCLADYRRGVFHEGRGLRFPGPEGA